MFLAAWQNTVSAVAESVAAIGLFVGAIAIFQAREQIRQAGLQIKEGRLSRHADVLGEVSRRWEDQAMVESRQTCGAYADGAKLAAAVETAFAGKATLYFVLTREPNFFEDIAIYVRRGVIDFELVNDSFGRNIVVNWERWLEAVRFLRRSHGEDEETGTTYEHYQWLAGEVAKYRA